MPLKTALDEFRAEFLTKVPAEIATAMEQATLQLTQDYASKPLLQIGDLAPDFELPNALGKNIRLSDRLQQGAVILTFYRGGWCPYCNLELRAYQRILPQIQAVGASLIAISPQTPDASLSTAEKNQLDFDVLSDRESKVAQAYKIAFQLPVELKRIYSQFGHALPHINDTEDWQLPIPATFAIAPNGEILLAHIDTDYRKRLEPSEALTAIVAKTLALSY
ncbi:AhpC/Tsa family protein, selenocysteine-containing [Pseudanabaena sp. lw0831]|uniref:peroxiredoxin-like family protein n=1 Tax=Pseudanabaena sp. lw0831 TaxID=1357935 RepID=UPI001A21CD60|nr:peroxiredoxin-like family protein [Pseudanabaena sp. lw0831]GBO55669.1 AhpC/Tsa family protein, selenocysteine-containing [Pseudanabaena sp. lw0831]